MANEDIRIMAKEKGVKLWELAEVLGINDGNFSRKLRKELSNFEKEDIIRAIEKMYEYKQSRIEN